MTVETLKKANDIYNDILNIEKFLSFVMNDERNVQNTSIMLHYNTKEESDISFKLPMGENKVEDLLLDFLSDYHQKLKDELEKL